MHQLCHVLTSGYDEREAISFSRLQPLGLKGTKFTVTYLENLCFFSIDFKLQLLDPALSGASTFKMRQIRFITEDAGDEKQWYVQRCQSLNAGISHRASASLICCLSSLRSDKCITITRSRFAHTHTHTHNTRFVVLQILTIVIFQNIALKMTLKRARQQTLSSEPLQQANVWWFYLINNLNSYAVITVVSSVFPVSVLIDSPFEIYSGWEWISRKNCHQVKSTWKMFCGRSTALTHEVQYCCQREWKSAWRSLFSVASVKELGKLKENLYVKFTAQ